VKRFGVAVTSAQVNLRDTGVKLESWQHSTARDMFDGAKIQPGTITYNKLGSNEIYIRVLACVCENQINIPADSTGPKIATSRFKFSKKHVKQLILRAYITRIPSDCTIRVELYNQMKGTVIDYLEFVGASGEDEKTITDLTGIDDGDILQVRANVTTASATSEATFDIGYMELMIDYGVS